MNSLEINRHLESEILGRLVAFQGSSSWVLGKSCLSLETNRHLESDILGKLVAFQGSLSWVLGKFSPYKATRFGSR